MYKDWEDSIDVERACEVSQALQRTVRVTAHDVPATAYVEGDEDGHYVEYDYSTDGIDWQEEYTSSPDFYTPLELLGEFAKLLKDDRVRAIIGEGKAQLLSENCEGWESDYFEVIEE